MIKRFIPWTVKNYLREATGLARLDRELRAEGQWIETLRAQVSCLEQDGLARLSENICSLREQFDKLRRELKEGRHAAEYAVPDLEDSTGAAAAEQASRLTSLEQRLAILEQQLGEARPSFPGVWRENNLCEPVVGLALRDLCRPGTVVFDCGANEGLLSILMSRLVGPRGVVCAFEASPRVVDRCLRNVIHNGCTNATLYHGAIFSESNQVVPIYFGDHTQADSIMPGSTPPAGGGACPVPTLALDDYVRRTGLIPDLVKMDIEGAEYHAVLGLRKTIEQARPHLILETQVEDDRCLTLLRALGYRAIDLNTYREVRGMSDYPVGVSLRNLLYIHQERLASTGYELPFRSEEADRVSAADCEALPGGSLRQNQPLVLPRGRYLIDVQARAARSDNEMICGVRVGETIAMMHQCNTEHTFRSYRDWVISLTTTAPVRLFFEFQRGTSDPTFSFTEATIRRLPLFDTWPMHLVG